MFYFIKMSFTSDIVIGLEIHIQLNTNTKLFCSCPTTGDNTPNSRTCPVCLGHPGSKPVLNKKAVEYGIRLALALDSDINKELIFSRKSYFYPDMSKNYQISQYEIPLAEHGYLALKTGKKIRLTRIHLEEDPASLVHPAGMHSSNYVLVDYNRSGIPLLEIVTEPDLASPEEAREFMKELITLVNYLGIFDNNTCIIKADANVSIKESGYIRSEIKNITGFKEIERALIYEVKRQKQAIANNENLIMDTRSWDAAQGLTRRIRTKETEDDYGYIIDPDLVITDITDDWIKSVKSGMPELPQQKLARYIEMGLSKDDAVVLVADFRMAGLFEELIKTIEPVLVARWLRRELIRVLNYNKKTLADISLDKKALKDILTLIQEKKITDRTGQRLMEKLVEGSFDVMDYVKQKGLEIIDDSSMIKEFCNKAIAENPKAVEDFRQGNEKSLNFLVGQVMRMSRGKANPAEVNKLLREMI